MIAQIAPVNRCYMNNKYQYLEEDTNMPKPSLRVDNELFDEELHVVHRLISARLIELPNGGESWEISDNDEIVFTVPGVRLTKKEKSVLKTAEGLEMLIREYKEGNKSVARIKAKLREYWKLKNDNL